ncbi:MAG: VOC family protein [Planctomycetota bacterium]|nr:VOC family protein [Planctomycetota bacterium]
MAAHTQIFVNLPVRNLAASTAFFRHLGFEIDPRFSGEHGSCVVFSDTIFAMLLTHDAFRSYTTKAIADATRTTEVLVCITRPRREDVDELVRRAVAAGGSVHKEPQEHAFMYGHAFTDLDGHIWEVIWLDTTALPTRV